MTLDQKKVLRELLRQSIEFGFGSSYPLKPIADKLEIREVLYDNSTNTGIMWSLGPHGDGSIYAHGDWPEACASIDYGMAGLLEHWTDVRSQPVG